MDDIEKIIKKSRAVFMSRKTLDISFRRKQLNNLYEMVEKNESKFIEALYKDIQKPKFEAKMIETNYVLNDIRGMIFNLDRYTTCEKVSKSLIILFDDAFIQNEPYGLVLIIGTWNYPLMVTLSPLIGAIAAGNVAIIQPSELAPNTSKLLAHLFPQYLDKDCYHIINGGQKITENLLQYKFDYVFFTGNKFSGSSIYLAAAKNLTPITLELGGKSPVYVDETVNNQESAFKRILWAKMVNAGQTCVAPDFVICSEKTCISFVLWAKKILKDFFGSEIKKSPDFTRIITENHFKRLENLLKSSKAQIAVGGQMDLKERYIEPTILVNVKPDDPIMSQEIFGPILPIMIVKTLDEAIDIINRGSKPLTLYIFSKNQTTIDRLRKETSSGSICVNDALIHLNIDSLPFGGVGESGFGVYHGKYTFETFSHKKSVLIRGYSPILEWVGSKRYPPYSESNLKRLLKLIQKRQVPVNVNFFKFLLGFLTFYICQIIFNLIV